MPQPVHILEIEVRSMAADDRWWPAGADLKTNLLAAFRYARQNGAPMGWAYEPEDLFKVVVGLALVKTKPESEDHRWVSAQMKALAQFSHVMEGAKLGIGTHGMEAAAATMVSVPVREYGLMGLWHESATP